MEEYPNVLIVTTKQEGNNTQTFLTLKNIWQQWPKEKLGYVFIDETNGKRKDYYNSREVIISLKDRPIARLAKGGFSRKLNKSLKNCTDDGNRNPKKRALKLNIRQYAYSFIDNSPVIIRQNVIEEVKSIHPDVIYTMGSSITVMKVAYRLSIQMDVPIIIHFMDNWPQRIQWEDNVLLKGYRARIDYWLKRIYSRCTCAMTISEMMARDYKAKTGIEHRALMNSIDLKSWKCKERANRADKVILTYAGGLHLGRAKTLCKLGEILDIQPRNDVTYILNVYTSINKYKSDISELEKYNSINVLDYISQKELKDVYEKSDILVLVESTEKNDTIETFTKYSISTKTAEYLATGRLILYIGNKGRELYDYLANNNAAIVVDDIDNVKAISELIPDNPKQIVCNAYELAKKNHDRDSLNERIINIISENIRFFETNLNNM